LEEAKPFSKPVAKGRGKAAKDGEDPKAKKAPAKKRKSDEMDDLDGTPKKGRGKAAAKKPKKDELQDSAEIKNILDDIPLVRPPTPPPKNESGKYAFNFANAKAQPVTTKEDLPEGAENCLAGLSFVFTGVLQTLDRDTGKSLVKRHGGAVMTAPSKKTSYVVLGSDAGPSKLNTIKTHGIKTINEEGLFKLIRSLPANGGGGAAGQAALAKREKEEAAILKKAQEMEEEDRKAAALLAKKSKVKSKDPMARPPPKVISNDSKLWTVKHAPTGLEQIVGNKKNVERLCEWLRNFRKNARLNFKVAGKEGLGIFRAVMIYGPPGVGKTTAAHLAAKLEEYDVVESNASDTRSKKMIDDNLKGVLGTTSLLGYFAGDGKDVNQAKKQVVLVMDEVDGMSAGDRGGVGALAAIVKKTQVPIILICNDRKQPKMNPFNTIVYEMQFRRPTTDQIKARIMTIAYREGMKIPPTVLTAMIEGTGADIRQCVNMLSTVKLDDAALDFNKGKEISKAWEKHVILKPFDISNKIMGGAMFDKNSKSTLNDKTELYFNDHEFSHLMVQENYLKTNPALANHLTGPERTLKVLELAEKAAESISDGDLVDKMIHGSTQQWSLMPTHAIFSFVRPASFTYGSLGYSQTGFTSWLGNNSKQQKNTRSIKEIQGHMRLRSSADRWEVRQQYVPMFWNRLPKRLMVEGKDAVPDIIDLMDSYFLTKDDYESIIELGIGPMDAKHLKIEAPTKTAFTRS
jgi:replication factor C subunit 1